jgi:hypothetical protein
MTDTQARNAAFEMVRMHGFVEAQRLAEYARDMNSEGTYTFAAHNAVCKWLYRFATTGTSFRTVD